MQQGRDALTQTDLGPVLSSASLGRSSRAAVCSRWYLRTSVSLLHSENILMSSDT